MPTSPIGRRAFLGATGGVLLAGALGGPRSVLAATATKRKELSALYVSIDLYASPTPQRLGVVLYRGARPIAGPPVRVMLIPPGAKEGTVFETKLSKRGLPGGRGVYVVDAVLPEPGTWTAVALLGREQAPLALDVNAFPTVPIIGSSAPRAPSPTRADTLGVKPICTRHPACGLHKESLSALIGTGDPVAVMFATPAYCQTATCGPVLDELLSVKDRYEGRVKFVHVEIYRNNKSVKVAPTVEAWQLPGEPWLFTIDGSGTIAGRLDGAFGREEVVAELDALATR